MVKALNIWSLPGGMDGSLDPKEAIRQSKEAGFQGVELAIGGVGLLTPDATQAYCAELVDAAEKSGIKLMSVASGLYWQRNLGDSDAAKRLQAQDDLSKMIQVTAWLGAKTLLTIPGAVDVFFMPDRPVQSYREVLVNATAGLRTVLPIAEKCGVRLGLENVWNKFLISPGEMGWFLDQFNSPFLGAYLDVGNVLPFGYPEDWIEYLGSQIVGVHFKDFRKSVGTADGFVDLLEGDVDFYKVMTGLRAVNYDGPLVAEMIPLYQTHPMVRVNNASRAMDEIMKV